MLFPTVIFLFLFLPLTLGIYYGVLRNRVARNVFLSVMSLIFYAWGEPFFVGLMILSIILNWLFACLIDREQKRQYSGRLYFCLSLLVNVGILFWAKYFTFTTANLNVFMNLLSQYTGVDMGFLDFRFNIPVIDLPLGISFFTFQAMSYVIDVYWKRTEVQKSLLNVCLYISLFPQLVAGPIVRYTSIAEQIQNRKENWDDFTQGICRFVLGLAKKVIVADAMAVVADLAFKMDPSTLSLPMAWLGSIAYTLQIYFDFSAYSDMAIGLGRMFGFTFPENFNYPYIARSVTDFWRRWHMSLSSWFRDYLYIPLGGNRVKLPRMILNLFIVWLCTGIWHGANWTFISWGLYYFVLLTIEKLFKFEERAWFKYVCYPYAILSFVLGWTLFRANNFTHLSGYLKAMFSFDFHWCDGSLYVLSKYPIYFAIALVLCLPVYPWLRSYLDRTSLRWRIADFVVTTAIFALVLFWAGSLVIKNTYVPFIYSNF